MKIIVFILILIYSFNTIQDIILTNPAPENQSKALESNSYTGTKVPSPANIQDTPDPATQTALIKVNPITLPPTRTQGPSPTLLIFSTLGPDIMTPFGPGGEFILHDVQPGESLALLANTYETSIEVLIRINVFPQGPSIWDGQIVIVMPNRVDPAGLSALQVVRLEVRTRVVDISEEYGVSIYELTRINSLGLDEWLPVGRWLIIPFSTETNQ